MDRPRARGNSEAMGATGVATKTADRARLSLLAPESPRLLNGTVRGNAGRGVETPWNKSRFR